MSTPATSDGMNGMINKRKGAAQSNAAVEFKWKDCDKKVDRKILRNLQKYKTINPDDYKNNDTIPNMQSVLSKYLTLAKKNKKCKLIILVRHGEGYHNWAKWELYGPEEWSKNQSTNLKWKDPHLTKTGISQVQKLLPIFECVAPHIKLVISSPLHRAIETATHAFLPLIQKNNNKNNEDSNEYKDDDKNNVFHEYKCPVYILEYCRERVNYHSCDSRNDESVIKKEWKDYDFKYQGFETNEDIVWQNKNYKHEPRETLWKRCAKMMDFVMNRDEDIVVYSGHCDFIMALMEVIVDMPFYKPRNASFFPIIVTSI